VATRAVCCSSSRLHPSRFTTKNLPQGGKKKKKGERKRGKGGYGRTLWHDPDVCFFPCRQYKSGQGDGKKKEKKRRRKGFRIVFNKHSMRAPAVGVTLLSAVVWTCGGQGGKKRKKKKRKKGGGEFSA